MITWNSDSERVVKELVDGGLIQELYCFWESEGISEETLVELLGVRPSKHGINFPERLNFDKVEYMHQYAMEATNEGCYPIRIGSFLADSGLQVVRLVYNSKTLIEGLIEALRFETLFTESVALNYRQLNDETIIRFEAVDTAVFGRYYAAIYFGMIVAICKNVLGEKVQAFKATIIEDKYMQRNCIAEFCDFPVSVGSFFELRIPTAFLLLENEQASSDEFKSILIKLSKQQDRTRRLYNSYMELRQVISGYLSNEDLSQQLIANELSISVRKLQRLLQSLGTNYQELLDDCRREVALKMVSSGNEPLHEIAFAIGYREPSAFYKAFKRWLGMTPGEYRNSITYTASEDISLSAVSSKRSDDA